MKVAIAYPPLKKEKGVPLLSQNRQFQYFREPTYIYPVVPAQAATMLKEAGHEVVWIDGIASGMSYAEFLETVRKERPDLVAIETKTPVVRQHWRIIDELKRMAYGLWPMALVLFGDHVTALPGESFENSRVDFVLTGGDYDFLLVDLCDYLSGSPAKELEPGIWHREGNQVKNTGVFRLDHDLNAIPFIDRDLTRWKLYASKNGNFKKTPGTYIMSGRDCWWGKCSFCAWNVMYPTFRARSVENVLDEIGLLVERYPIREIMDDSGTFPVGPWLEDFCRGMAERGLNRNVILDCNMRFGILTKEQYRLMKKAGFRLILFGLESGNQKTLDRVHKNVTVQGIIESCKKAREAGLYPHITLMFGYPWETYADALKTLRLGRWLLRKGYAYTVQATIVIPYPGSGLFEECLREGWLKTQEWDDYDMKQPVMKTPMDDRMIQELVQGIYKVALDPVFIWNRLVSMRDWHDLLYFKRGIKKVFGHISDFW